MADPALEIIDAAIDLMIADSDFDDIAAFYAGVHPFPPLTHYPLCEVMVTDEQEISLTTGRYERQLNGFIRFSTRFSPDVVPTVTARKASTVTTYQTVAGWLQSTKDLFAATANRDLGNLTFDNGGLLLRFVINTDAQIGLEERNNNFENEGVISFTATIQEART